MEFTFHKGHAELAVLILSQLARVCGPVVLFADAFERTILVTDATNPAAAKQLFE